MSLRLTLLLFLLLGHRAMADVYPFYIGTMTGPSASQGIYLGNRIAVLKIDRTTGQLTATDQSAVVDAPVCVLFVPKK